MVNLKDRRPSLRLFGVVAWTGFAHIIFAVSKGETPAVAFFRDRTCLFIESCRSPLYAHSGMQQLEQLKHRPYTESKKTNKKKTCRKTLHFHGLNTNQFEVPSISKKLFKIRVHGSFPRVAPPRQVIFGPHVATVASKFTRMQANGKDAL